MTARCSCRPRKLRRASDGNVIDKTFRAGEKFRAVRTEARKMQFLYADGTEAHFMDTESYETISFDEAFVGEAKDYLTENLAVDVLYVEGKPANIELPSSVNLKVAESAEGVRGDSANNVMKPAVLETGLSINVPLFINEGELVKVDTRTGSYMGRA